MSSANPNVSAGSLPGAILLRRFFPVYCLIAALVTFGYARYDTYQLDGDAVAYMDIGDLLRGHRWAGVINSYWHPLYPAFLSLGHLLFRASRFTELRAYYYVNFGIFLLEMMAVVCFTDAIVRLRASLPYRAPLHDAPAPGFVLDQYGLRYLGLALLVFASQRELSLGKVRPDALLQAMLLLAFASLLTHLATGRARYAALMGLALGCAYLTKSFALLPAILCLLAVFFFRRVWLRQSPLRVLLSVATGLLCFAMLAGPYVASLSTQKHRLDFGDSGSLNYAWFVAGTQKMHLQPDQASSLGSAEVRLKHPEAVLWRDPHIFSYAQLPYGTCPDWFDPTYWNEQVKPHLNVRRQIAASWRNVELMVRYLCNHPEAPLLFGLLLMLGSRLSLPLGLRSKDRAAANVFWLVPLTMGVSIWGIYAIVNTEERYVTVAYLCVALTLFAALSERSPAGATGFVLRPPASALVLLLALVAVGGSLRDVLEDRRQLSLERLPGGWYSPAMVHAAEALGALGVKPGDQVACLGESACLVDPYWARLAGVRILTEIYDPQRYPSPTPSANSEHALNILRRQGARVLVADLGQQHLYWSDPAMKGWFQLGDTSFYALRLTPMQLP